MSRPDVKRLRKRMQEEEDARIEAEKAKRYDPSEQDEIIETFAEMLRAVTADGGRKRQAGEKPSWKVDPGHEKGLFSHLYKWKAGELVDPDSGAHPLVHMAWRALAIAWQEVTGIPDVALSAAALYQHQLISRQTFERVSGQRVGTPTGTFKHKPCQRCQTQGYESAGQPPDIC